MGSAFLWGLLGLFAISFLGSGPVPLPLTVSILWLGQFKMPVWVVLVATLGSLSGWLVLEKSVRKWAEERPELIHQIPTVYRQFFMKKLGLWLFLFNALPLPLDFIRFLALMSGYDRWRLAVILTMARLVRNTILVSLGAALAQHQVWLWAIMLGFMLLPLLVGQWFQAQPDEQSRAALPDSADAIRG
ncbi:hypothetical protein [Vampirovibrio sp.]|uniref:hypothetical protein n=1 Tax=Vampirovibrio sp. TaxID=2717857 RepID=UPI003594651D